MRCLPLAFAFLCSCVSLPAAPSVVDTLAARGKLGIPLDQARQLESHLGQLLVINVDGFGYAGPLALAPAFVQLVNGLQVGGVIPHYGSVDYDRIARTNHALAALTTAPLLLCADIVKLRGADGIASFGDGYVGGFLGHYRDLGDDELSTLARLNAFVFTALGLNVALGPTIDASTADPRVVDRARIVLAGMKAYGIQPVIKHYPALPAEANLHRESPDTKLTADEAALKADPFRVLAGDVGIMMTTHFRDTLVDASLVTFSSRWNALLRGRTGFQGLLMSDGLLMLKNYADRTVLGGDLGALTTRDVAGIDETAVWAARAILAGHDMVIVEGSAAQTTRAFEGLVTLACSGSTGGRALLARVEESYGRIMRWKNAHAAELRRTVSVPAPVIQAVIALLPDASARLTAFRFDPGRLARLAPDLTAAEAPSGG